MLTFEGLQVGPIEAVFEMPIDDNMAVIDQPLHNKKGNLNHTSVPLSNIQ